MEARLAKYLYHICAASGFVLRRVFTSDTERFSNPRLRAWCGLMQHEAHYRYTRIQLIPPRSQGPYPGINAFHGPVFRPGAVWITAHHDYIDGVGAVDNATALALMVEVARQLPWHLRERVVFGSFADEERCMAGSRAFVERHPEILPRISGVLNLECLGARGYETAIGVSKKGTRSNARLVQQLQRADPRLRRHHCVPDYYSDFVRLARAGVATVELVGLPQPGTPGIVHTQHDVPANVDFAELARLVGITVEFLRRVA